MFGKTFLMLAAAAPLFMFAPTQARADHVRDRDFRRDVEVRADIDVGRRAVAVVTAGYYRTEVCPAECAVRYDIRCAPPAVVIVPARRPAVLFDFRFGWRR